MFTITQKEKIFKENSKNQLKYLAYTYGSIVACRPDTDLEEAPIYSCFRKYLISNESQRIINNCTSHSYSSALPSCVLMSRKATYGSLFSTPWAWYETTKRRYSFCWDLFIFSSWQAYMYNNKLPCKRCFRLYHSHLFIISRHNHLK